MDLPSTDNNQPATHQRKPSTPRRIAASRSNGKLSTGPSTPTGQQAASDNRITHGMLAQSVVLNGESKPRFDALLNSFIAAHRPITEPEFALVHKMVVAYWRQMRTWSIQKTDFDREMARQDESAPAPFRDSLAFRALSGDGHSLALALRYESTFERQFSRAHRDLAQLKAERDPTAGLSTFPTSSIASSTWLNEEENQVEEQEKTKQRRQ